MLYAYAYMPKCKSQDIDLTPDYFTKSCLERFDSEGFFPYYFIITYITILYRKVKKEVQLRRFQALSLVILILRLETNKLHFLNLYLLQNSLIGRNILILMNTRKERA